jgi:hypothetical protein
VVSLVTKPTSDEQLAEWEQRLEGKASTSGPAASAAFH